MLSPRLAPPMIGLGLLEAIPESEIVARADPNDANGDGIKGKANYVWDAAIPITKIRPFWLESKYCIYINTGCRGL